jgi:hypothetical protein
MTRRVLQCLTAASLAFAVFSTAACTRTDATGPSDQQTASLETQGSGN